MNINENTQVVDPETGESIGFQEALDQHFSELATKGGFQLTYTRILTEYINVANSPSATILAYLIKAKNAQNIVIGTNRSISKTLGVSTVTVNKVIKALREKGMLRMMGQGVYMINPNIMAYGGRSGFHTRGIWKKAGLQND